MNTLFKEAQRGQVVLADAAGHALSGYNTFCCGTPAAFEAKAKHLPAKMMAGTALIMIDVLRATSTLTAVGAADANGIHVAIKPTNGINPLTAPTKLFGPWLGGGEENGKPIVGGCIANSPTEVSDGMFCGSWLKFVSTNGARAISVAETSGSDRLYLACLRNIHATVATAIIDGADRILFGSGGFYGSSTLEDTVCAGLGIKALIGRAFATLQTVDDEALMALSVANDFDDDEHLVRALKDGSTLR